jgi:hypothetical protein
VVVTAVLAGVAGFVTSGVVAGISLVLGFSGVLSLVLLLLPARPRVAATLRGAENAVTGTEKIALLIGGQTVRPFDIDEIVKDQEDQALDTMPRAPTPIVPPGAFGGAFDISQSTANMLSSMSGASDEELRAFVDEVQTFGDELRAWLEQLQAARHERLRAFTAVARIFEIGQAPADFARLRLRFPEAFEEPEQPPEVSDPPERPEFVGRYGRIGPGSLAVRSLARGSLARFVSHPDESRGAAPEYSREDSSTVVALNIGHINQHDHRDTAEFALRAAPPGVYEVKWQVSANGLSPPTMGRVQVEVREPASGEPITELRDALAERDHHSLD